MIKLKWLGKQATRVRPAEGALKIDVKPLECFDCEDKLAKVYLGYKNDFEVCTMEVKKEEVKVSEPKKEEVKVSEPKKEVKKLTK
jgi:hypothetical protein